MSYDARQIANWFVTRAERDGRNLSIMSLLKLVYIAHGWSLESLNAPLFGNRIEAWRYGPVIPDVYNDFRRQGVKVTESVNTVSECALDPEREKLLEQVWAIYGGLPAFRLSDMTHVAGGPWNIVNRIGGPYAEIPDDLIQSHYADLRRKAVAAAEVNG
ncbi:MAG: Panacea domain-containing protein [Pikeienuella sp.]